MVCWPDKVASFGMFILKLKRWDERPDKEDNVQAVIGQVYGRTADIKDATIFAIAPAMIPGYGMGNALEMHTQDKAGGDLTTFFNTTQQYLAALRERPEIATAYSTFDIKYPQWQRGCGRGEMQAGRNHSGCCSINPFRLLRRAICVEYQPLLEGV